MFIQRLNILSPGSSIYHFLQLFRRRSYSAQDLRSRVIESLKPKFDMRYLQIENQKLKIFIRDSVFHGMPMEMQHKLVLELLPKDIRNEVIIETSSLQEENVDHEVRKVQLSNIPILFDNNVPATPQFLLDSALYHFSKNSGVLSSECLWLCGSLALKNFAISNGFNPKIHSSKDRIVDFLKKSIPKFRTDLGNSWENLNGCQRNIYEDSRDLDIIRDWLKDAELFCNILYEIHVQNQFACEKFKESLPDSMKKKDNVFFEFY